LRMVNRSSEGLWWRRSITVPMPLAVAIGFLIGVLVYSSFRSGREPVKEVATAPTRSVQETKVQPSELPAAVRSKSDGLAKWKQYQSEVYLCGVGQVSSESYYGVTE
jgi:hypothetical protein